MSLSIGNNFLSSIASSALKSLAPALSSQIQGLLQQVAGPVDSFTAGANPLSTASGSGATRLSPPPADLSARSGAGATGAGFTNTFAPNLNAKSGGAGPGEVGGVGDVASNPALGQFWGQLDAQQKASIGIQQAISKQTEAAALISNIMKAKHDAQMQILGNLK